MILVRRGRECAGLADVRKRELPKLRKLKKPSSDDIKGYDIAAEPLWKAQHSKCCYCEHKITESYNDVEHYRPKADADRGPGSKARHGYWWLAFTWTNLLFACPSCNRSAKRALFPLLAGGAALRLGQAPPGQERPLLLDPAGTISPVKHIEFIYRAPKKDEPTQSPGLHQWFARPRSGSVKGDRTIHVCGLNHQNLLELRRSYVEDHVEPAAKEINEAITEAAVTTNSARLHRAFARAMGLLHPRVEYVGLTYDALRFYVSESALARCGLAWPAPERVGLPLRPAKPPTLP